MVHRFITQKGFAMELSLPFQHVPGGMEGNHYKSVKVVCALVKI
jgi:hypothetical protein